MKDSIIIFGFPGTGKSFAFNHQEELELTLQDSDSSHFHWVYAEDDTEFKNPLKDEFGNKIPHPAWPANYAQYIELTGREQTKKPDYIFVSTHEEVMSVIGDLKFRSFTIVPTRNSKEFYLNLYKERGNDEAFIKMMDEKWDEFIDGTMKRACNLPGENFLILVGPDRPVKNVYDLLAQGPEVLFPMEFKEV